MDDMRENIKDQNTWVLGFFIIVFLIFYGIAETLVVAIVIYQFLSRLLTRQPNEKLLGFSMSLNHYILEVLNYLTQINQDKPFPFADWPEGDGKQDAVGDQ